MKERIAIFGGTFNPIHNGHLHLCVECQKELQFDRMILMPDNIPPHKEVGYLAGETDRYEMCRIAAGEYPFLEASDLELRMDGISYTVYTLQEIKRLYPQAELYFIIGSDMLYSFHKWYRYQEILSLAFLVAGAREREEYDRMVQYTEKLGSLSSRVRIVRFHALPLSSTQVRKALHLGDETVSGLLPAGVLEYIKKHGLYQFGKGKA